MVLNNFYIQMVVTLYPFSANFQRQNSAILIGIHLEF